MADLILGEESIADACHQHHGDEHCDERIERHVDLMADPQAISAADGVYRIDNAMLMILEI